MLSLWISPSLASVTTPQTQSHNSFMSLIALIVSRFLNLYSFSERSHRIRPLRVRSLSEARHIIRLKVKKLQPKLAFIDEVHTGRPFCSFCVKINNHWMFLSFTFEYRAVWN
ncbi:uncharacterized protein HKW66_Vig0055460 [Vigna angularis]|uniref:Uncharacterized protein n=2 Tax=Phaseolus angularis TaxID=3914 RepID=A0A8T0L0V0_PHAAN|nr:uncharacterized protein LOC108328727 [Vigna angularis]KAG2406290.1 uncharacterized protein HKW66_Vig0055460 [Vigna angularis]BAT85970.1 hypothetical protein VIGAN_04357600 [Vigna angularis var. angularis]